MRPVPFTRELRAHFPGHASTIVMSGPSGDLTDTEVAPVEVIRYFSALYGRAVPTAAVILRPEAGELELLTAGAPVLLAFVGSYNVPVFATEVLGPLVEAEVDPDTGDVVGTPTEAPEEETG